MRAGPSAATAALTVWLALAAAAEAQERPATPAAAPQGAEEPQDEDLRRDPSQPDFATITQPTTLRLPRGKTVFRLTHRFSRQLGEGDLGDLFDDFLGFDSAAQIGIEFRYGLRSGTQIGIHRTNDKTIQLFAQQDLLPQRSDRQYGVNAMVTVEGLDNFREQRSIGLGGVLSRRLGDHGAVYAWPIWLTGTNLLTAGEGEDDGTFLLGLSARLRVRPSVYLLAQVSPRLAGHAPGEAHTAFGIERRVGGHTFQLNFSRSLGSTPRQIAQGGSAVVNNWHIGFNISRKFY